MAALAETSYGVERHVWSAKRSTILINPVNDDAGAAIAFERDTVNVVINYEENQNRVTLTVSIPPEDSQASVRNVYANAAPDISTGFSVTNGALVASMVIEASEVLLFAGLSPPPPITVEAFFRGRYLPTHQKLVKIIISDSGIFSPLLNRGIVSKTELSMYTSQRYSPGTLFGFLRLIPGLGDAGLEELILSASDGNRFTVQGSLARKLRRMYNQDISSRTLRVEKIPEPLLWLLRFNFERDISDAKIEMVRELIMLPSVFILSVLKWIPYLWNEEMVLCGCKILGERINYLVELGHDLYSVALSLGME